MKRGEGGALHSLKRFRRESPRFIREKLQQRASCKISGAENLRVISKKISLAPFHFRKILRSPPGNAKTSEITHASRDGGAFHLRVRMVWSGRKVQDRIRPHDVSLSRGNSDGQRDSGATKNSGRIQKELRLIDVGSLQGTM